MKKITLFLKAYLYNLATDKYHGFGAGIAKIFLWLLSLIYLILVYFLMFFQKLIRTQRLKCKVISVGNITLGGTGKTPIVEFIAKYLKNKGHKVAVLTRGYGRHKKLPLICINGRNPMNNNKLFYQDIGDEALMLSQKLEDTPIFINSDRISSANQAMRDFGVDTVILDDGFQQWSIKKDLEIVVFNANNPLGNLKVIPRGVLRQPVSTLRQADIFIFSNYSDNELFYKHEELLKKINPDAFIFKSKYIYADSDIEGIKAKKALVFSGIGSPESFEQALKLLGVDIAFSLRFADHHSYTGKDLENIISQAQNNRAEVLITTEKDAARVENLNLKLKPLPLIVLPAQLEIIKNDEEFFRRLLSVYSI